VLDAAGKDGAIKHVMSGVNPQGCPDFSVKQPSATELEHDFLWRTTRDHRQFVLLAQRGPPPLTWQFISARRFRKPSGARGIAGNPPFAITPRDHCGRSQERRPLTRSGLLAFPIAAAGAAKTGRRTATFA
jgi:hypothetical protein